MKQLSRAYRETKSSLKLLAVAPLAVLVCAVSMGLLSQTAYAANYQLSAQTTAIRKEGGWIPGSYGGHDASRSEFPSAALRFKATTSSVSGMMYQQGQKVALYVDGTRVSVVTVPNTSTWADTTLFTGLDNATEHTYMLVMGIGGQYVEYLTVDSLNTASLTARPTLAWYGDSIVAGFAGTGSDSSLSDVVTICNLLNYACENRGIGATTVKHFAASNDGETRFADINGISPVPAKVFIRYGLNDSGQIAGAETAADLQTAYTNMLTSLTAGSPSTIFYATSIIKTAGGGYPTDRSTWDAAIATAASTVNTLRGNSNIRFIDTSGWTEYTATTGSGQTTDNVHPTAAGYALLANRELPLLATSGVTASGPSTGPSGQASTNFTVSIAAGATFTGDQTITLSDGGNGGTFTPSVGSSGTSTVAVTPSNGATSFTFAYTAASTGSKTITLTNGQSWGNPSTLAYTATDVVDPSVSITAPTANAVVSGSSVTLSANATDNVSVVGVQFKVDGVNIGTEDTSAPYSVAWDSTAATEGSHTITAVARDAAGNSSASSPVTVTVDNLAPIIVAVATPATQTKAVTTSQAANESFETSTENVTASESVVDPVKRETVKQPESTDVQSGTDKTTNKTSNNKLPLVLAATGIVGVGAGMLALQRRKTHL